MEWGDIWAIVWLIALPVLMLVWVLGDRFRAYAMDKIGERSVLFNSLFGFSTGAVILRRSLVSLAVLFLVVAIMQPRKFQRMERFENKVLNLIICLDTSKSMLAQDLKPDRLTRAKIEIQELTKRLSGDRIALIVFSGQALVQCPFTTDYSAFNSFLSSVSVDTVPTPGTNIASALELVLKISKKVEGNKAVLLITDGEDFNPDKTIAYAKRCKTEGIKIYCVGIGSLQGEPIPLPGGGFKRDESGKVVLTRLQEDLLVKIAQITGGAYVRAGTSEIGIGKIYDLISSEKRSLLQAGRFPIYSQYYVYPLAVAVVLLFVAWFLDLPKVRGAVNAVVFIFLLLPLAGWRLDYLSNDKAVRLLKKGKVEEARKILSEIRERSGEDPIINYNLGVAEERAGKDPTTYYQSSGLKSETDPRLRAMAMYNLGNFYLRSGRLKEAIDAYEKALLANPEMESARYNLELALKRLTSQKKQSQKSQSGSKGQRREEKGQDKEKEKKETGKANQEKNGQKKQSQGANKGDNNKNDTSRSGEERNRQSSQKETGQEGVEQGKRKNSGEGRQGENQDRSGKAPQGLKGEGQKEGKRFRSEEAEAILQALQDEELSPNQINRRKELVGEYDVDKDW